jgi:hypothetical protein
MSGLRFSLLYLLVCSPFLMAPGSRAEADALEDAKRALTRGQRDLTSAQAAVKKAADAVTDAARLVNQSKTALDRSIVALNNAEKNSGSAHDLVVQAQTAFTKASEELGRLRSDLTAKQNALDAAKSLVDRLLLSSIVLYDMKWTIRIEYNSVTSSFNAWAELPDGLKVTSSALSAAFRGDVPLPEIDPTELIATAFGFQVDRQCDFDAVVAKIYGDAGAGASVYVSTRGLAELLSPEHLADAGVKAVLSGGSTIEGSADEIATGCLNELNGAFAFLQQTASTEANRLLDNIMDAILTGSELDTPTVQIKLFQARMDYVVKPTDGALAMLNYIPSLQKKITQLGLKYSYPRLGFAIIVKNRPVATRGTLQARVGSAKSLSPNALKLALPAASYQVLELALTSGGIDPMALVSNSLETMVKGIDFSTLPIDTTFPYCLDLRGTALGKELERLAGDLKIGNQATAKLSRLSFNFHTGQISTIIDLDAKDVTTLEKAISLAGKTVEDVSSDAVRSRKAAEADVEKVRQQINAATMNVGAASTNLAKRSNDLHVAQDAVNSAKSTWGKAAAAENAAVAMENHRNDDLRNARSAMAQVQSRINDAQKLIDHLSHLIPSPPPIRHFFGHHHL